LLSALVTQGSYQKSSFFDTISCDALDRLEGNKGRLTASDERRLNTETFGAVGLNNRRNFRSGRGGRGGRGGGRRGGGGYRNGGGWNGGRGGGGGGRGRNNNNSNSSSNGVSA
jgi:protein LSM14